MVYNRDRENDKECKKMRPKTLRFEQLVHQNKQEILNDEKTLKMIEQRIEKKQEALVEQQRKELETK